MKILYIGDIMAETGIQVVEQVLPILKREEQIDIVIAQAENVSEGRGVTVNDFTRLKKAGIDFCTGGNWSLWRDEINSSMSDPAQPIIRPANYVVGTAGLGWKYISGPYGNMLVVSLLGKIVGRDSDKELDNPLRVIDTILDSQQSVEKVATIVNFHGDYSSEKVVIGHYLDGRVTGVIGDHWHVPTADARVLPGGTAHITDVGMCGVLDSSLGVSFDVIIERWRNQKQNRNVLETKGPWQFNAALIDSDPSTGLATHITSINRIIPKD
jgi:metallophosphoesterase (TIGR00282 family)